MIARSAFPRRVPVGRRVYDVPPPTVRDALELLYILEHGTDLDDEELFRMALRRWLPRRTYRAFLKMSPEKRAQRLKALIFEGVPEAKKDPKEKGKSKGRALSWDDAFVAFVDVFDLDPWQAYCGTPFPFLVAMTPHVRAVRARRELSHAMSSSAHNMKKGARKKYFDDLQKAAGQKTSDESRMDDYSEPLTEEELADNRDRLERDLKRAHG